MEYLEVFLTDEFSAFLGDVFASDGDCHRHCIGEAMRMKGATHHTHGSGLKRLMVRRRWV